jgi:restriction system protein
VKWHAGAVQRAEFSVPFQNSIRSSLTVFLVDHNHEFFTKIGKTELVSSSQAVKAAVSYHEAALEQILQLDPTEFEILISHVLSALGFESQHVGKVGDGGVDVEGELNVANMAKIKLFVQVKRYKAGSKINENTLKALRQNIPFGGQCAFITTSDFTGGALKAAVDPGFPRIGTINGRQLVDVLAENWTKIPPEIGRAHV